MVSYISMYFICIDSISQFSSVIQLCPTLCHPMDCRTPGFPVYHQLPKLAQTHVHWAIYIMYSILHTMYLWDCIPCIYERSIVILLTCWWGFWGTEKLTDFLKVTQRVVGTAHPACMTAGSFQDLRFHAGARLYNWIHLLAASAKLLQSCPTLCDPRDRSPPGSPVPGILQARTLEWVAISFSNAWKWKVKVKSLSRVWLFTTPWTAAHQAEEMENCFPPCHLSSLPVKNNWT